MFLNILKMSSETETTKNLNWFDSIYWNRKILVSGFHVEVFAENYRYQE